MACRGHISGCGCDGYEAGCGRCDGYQLYDGCGSCDAYYEGCGCDSHEEGCECDGYCGQFVCSSCHTYCNSECTGHLTNGICNCVATNCIEKVCPCENNDCTCEPVCYCDKVCTEYIQ